MCVCIYIYIYIYIYVRGSPMSVFSAPASLTSSHADPRQLPTSDRYTLCYVLVL